MLGLNRALHDILPALQTAVAITFAACAFVALLAAGVVAAWSFAFYLWLAETMSASQAAVVVGAVLLVLSVIASFGARATIRKSLKPEPPKPSKHDTLANALEAIGEVAEQRPLPALLSALVLGLAAGYLDGNGSAHRPR